MHIVRVGPYVRIVLMASRKNSAERFSFSAIASFSSSPSNTGDIVLNFTKNNPITSYKKVVTPYRLYPLWWGRRRTELYLASLTGLVRRRGVMASALNWLPVFGGFRPFDTLSNVVFHRLRPVPNIDTNEILGTKSPLVSLGVRASQAAESHFCSAPGLYTEK